MASPLHLAHLTGTFSVCRLGPSDSVPEWAESSNLLSITRTASELSIVCDQEAVPGEVQAERGWAALVVEGPLDFALVGILADLSAALAEAGVSLFAISTFDTDYLLVPETSLDRATSALRARGHIVA